MTRAYERFESLLFTVSMPYVLADNYCRKVATGNSTFSRYNHFSIGTSACVFIGSTFILYKSYTAPSEKGPLKLGKKENEAEQKWSGTSGTVAVCSFKYTLVHFCSRQCPVAVKTNEAREEMSTALQLESK